MGTPQPVGFFSMLLPAHLKGPWAWETPPAHRTDCSSPEASRGPQIVLEPTVYLAGSLLGSSFLEHKTLPCLSFKSHGYFNGLPGIR